MRYFIGQQIAEIPEVETRRIGQKVFIVIHDDKSVELGWPSSRGRKVFHKTYKDLQSVSEHFTCLWETKIDLTVELNRYIKQILKENEPSRVSANH